MNMCVSVPESGGTGRRMLLQPTVQNPVQGTGPYIRRHIADGTLALCDGCAATMHFRELQTAPQRTAMSGTEKLHAFITRIR